MVPAIPQTPGPPPREQAGPSGHGSAALSSTTSVDPRPVVEERARCVPSADLRASASAEGASGQAKLKPCGSRAAYQRHLRRGEEPCDACRLANNAEHRVARSAYSAARTRAYFALRAFHLEEFARLVAEEVAKEPVAGPRKQRNQVRTRVTQRALRRLARAHRDQYAALLERERAAAGGDLA